MHGDMGVLIYLFIFLWTWGRFIKLKNMEHACTALSEAETAINAQLSNHAWRAQTPMGLGHTSGEGEHAIISGSDQGAGQGRICM